MAILSNGSPSYVLSLKVLLISTGVLSMAMAMKLSVPVISQFAVCEVPLIYSFVISYLKPPYLYLVLNCIIITIVASSKLQNKLDESPEPLSSKIATDLPADFEAAAAEVYDSVISEVETTQKVMNGVEMTVGVDESVISRSSWTPPVRQDSVEFLGTSEKPPVSARFGHRKVVKTSPEAGKALRVSKPKRQDTLESTWKTITEGRPMPLTRHLRKSDTWETRHNSPHFQTTNTTPQKMKKSETFHDRSSTTSNNSSLSPSPGSGKLRKDPSLSQDELNRRVEAFINKFNEEMRLQRQESLNQYHEMIKRGAN